MISTIKPSSSITLYHGSIVLLVDEYLQSQLFVVSTDYIYSFDFYISKSEIPNVVFTLFCAKSEGKNVINVCQN